MNRNRRQYNASWNAAVAVGLIACSLGAGAQVPVDEDGNTLTTDVSPLDSGVDIENPAIESGVALSAAELETLVGPIALYPDDLLAVVLPASTYPLEIVQAARFVESAKIDSTLKPSEDWDDSVVALLNYPEVLAMMNEDIDWTWKLGEAVVSQQTELIAAIESFRDRAYAAGNLRSDERQTVSMDHGVIEIDPVEDDVIYVPYYEPEEVVVYSRSPVYHYYPRPCPVYYYPYSRDHYFRSGYFWGVTTAFTIGWATDRLHVYHHSYSGHPFYGHSYYGPFWRRPSINVYNSYYVDRYRPYYSPRNRYRHGDYWRPRYRSGPRPGISVTNRHYYRDRNRPRGDRRSFTESVGSEILNQRRRGSGRNATDTTRASREQNRRRDDAIRFRPRGNGAYTATRSPRMRNAERTDAAEQRRANRVRPETAAQRRADRTERRVNPAQRRVRNDTAAVRRTQVQTPRANRAAQPAAARERRATTRAVNSRGTSTRVNTRRDVADRQTTRRTQANRQSRAAAPRQPKPVRSQPRRNNVSQPSRAPKAKANTPRRAENRTNRSTRSTRPNRRPRN